MLTLSIPLPVHLPFHLTCSPRPPLPPRITIFLFHPPSVALPRLPAPKGPMTKIPRNEQSLIFLFLVCGQILFANLLVHQNPMASVASTASCTPGLLYSFGNWTPNVSDVEPELRSTDADHWFLRGGIGCWCQILLGTIFKICAQTPRWFSPLTLFENQSISTPPPTPVPRP